VLPERAWVHPEAIAKARAARQWYEARNAETAEAFMAELDLALERIEGGATPMAALPRQHTFATCYADSLLRCVPGGE